MAQIQSKLTSQGQVSVPATVRRALGIRPGSIIEWNLAGKQIFIKRSTTATTEEVHQALFGATDAKQARKTIKAIDIKAGIRSHMKKRHARG